MKVLDVSVELNENLPSWPEGLSFSRKENHLNSICVSELSLSAHTGTHIDAPYHFLPDGKKLDECPPHRFVGKTLVCQITDEKNITFEELKTKNLSGVDKILFKTNNSQLWKQDTFCYGFIGLESGAAEYLVNLGVKLIGADYLSIEAYKSEGNPVHKILLENDVLILEGLNLSEVPEGEYFLVFCPLKIKGIEAAPTRALLIKHDNNDIPA